MIKLIYILIVLSLIFVSCESDYLDVVDPNRATPDVYWTNYDECIPIMAGGE
jgi:hypothetical protein